MKFLYYDMEIYQDFWLVVFKDDFGRKQVVHSRMDYLRALTRLEKNIEAFLFTGFNNLRYDTVMLNYILKNYKRLDALKMAEEMFEMSQDIIENNAYYKQVMASKGIPEKTFQMDVSTFLSHSIGAKEIGCRLHHPKLETLPIHPHAKIKDSDIPILAEYCENDVDIVIAIAKSDTVAPEIQAVLDVVEYFGLGKENLGLSIGALIEEALVDKSLKPNPPNSFRYKSPVDFNFKTQEFKDIEETFKGLMLDKDSTFNLKTDIGRMEVSFGLGGVHGAVPQSFFEGLIDIDAKQYYPDMIKRYDLLPNTISDKNAYFKMIDDKEMYGELNDPREKSVKKGIVSIFGRMGFKNSKLYAPNNLFTVTITGQLLLLRLVEDLRDAGYEVVYMNTDGLTILDNGTTDYIDIGNAWAEEFKFTLKYVNFKKAFYRDVNNFVVETENGSLKRKGDFNTEPSHKRSCFAKVSVDAVVEHLLNGVSIRDYINRNDKLQDFLMYHKYNHNIDVFLLENEERKRLPNVVRYLLVNDRENAIVHQKEGSDTLANRNENKNVELVNNFDSDVVYDNVDKEQYVRIAYDMLHKVTGKDVEDNPYIEGLLEQIDKL